MTGVIYQIINTITNQKYVGSTKNFDRRKKSHIRKLKQGIHENKHLLNSFNKYGENCFQIQVLESVSVEDMLIIEQTYLDSDQFDFNICLIVKQPPDRKGYSPSKATREKISRARLGSNHTEATKAKMSKTRKGLRHSEKARENMSKMNPRNKEIVQMDISGKEIARYRSKSYATKITGIHLDATIAGRTKTAGGYKWKYLKS